MPHEFVVVGFARIPVVSKTSTTATAEFHYRDLIALRLSKSNLTAGLTGQHVDVFHLNGSSKLIAMRRWRERGSGGSGDDVIVVSNFSVGRKQNHQPGLPSTGPWKLRFNDESGIYDPAMVATESTDMHPIDKPRYEFPHFALVSIGAYTCLIYSQDQ